VSKSSRRNKTLQKTRSNITVTRTGDLARAQTVQPNNTRVIANQTISQYTSGPIPNAEQLDEYNRVLPGAADRILTMAEKQSEHRQIIEKKVIFSGAFRATFGVICAAVLCILFLAGGVWCIINDHDNAGTAIVVTSLVSLVTTFIYGTHSQRNERNQKKEASDKLIKRQ